ncbi:kinesin-like protein KIN-1 [Rutidosis leptorrhynchoides]|uniref:kinesin-like protein KIN-1 n=1 Tax=Rutidosis leptorrhynchoides TaxID=125765 RepID=UPI003A991248
MHYTLGFSEFYSQGYLLTNDHTPVVIRNLIPSVFTVTTVHFNFCILQDEKDEHYLFNFDKVFYEDSAQADVYDFLAAPIVRDALNAINGTIITYGQTGAGKTYTMEGGNILETDNRKKGLLPRVVTELFEAIQVGGEATAYKIKLSMVEIYMEKVRDLFDLSKDNIQVKEHKGQGILLCGVTEILISDGEEASKFLHRGIANRAVGETQMNMESSRSHCIYIFTIQKEVKNDQRVSSGKLVLVDLAGSEKVEKTGAEGRVLEEAKTINKSLSALGNVINALTSSQQGKSNHIPYRDSKLTRILQDALGGSSQTALLCCCSPSLCNSSETISTLRFGARAKHIKASVRVVCKEELSDRRQESLSMNDVKLKLGVLRDRILKKFGDKLDAETVSMIGEEFVLEGLITTTHPSSSDQEVNSSSSVNGITLGSETIFAWKEATDKLVKTIAELRRDKEMLMNQYESMKGEYEIMESVVRGLKTKLRKSQDYLDLGFYFMCLVSAIMFMFIMSIRFNM